MAGPFDTVADASFGAVVRAHACATPDAVALRLEERCWSYAALDAQAGRIARALLRDRYRRGDRMAHSGRNGDAVPLLALAAAGTCAAAHAPAADRVE